MEKEKDFFAKVAEAIETVITSICALAAVGATVWVLNLLSCINPFFVGVRTCSYTETTPYTDNSDQQNLQNLEEPVIFP